MGECFPSALIWLAASTRSGVITVGLPPSLPWARAWARPRMVFCRIVSTRSWANTATIPNRALPMGVVVSMSGSVRLFYVYVSLG